MLLVTSSPPNMKTSKNTITVLVIALVIGIAHFANATVRNFTFSGVITEFFALEGPPPGLPLPNLAVPGDRLPALPAGDYYWTEGLPDWRLVSQYLIIAKTVRVSAVPPPSSAESGQPGGPRAQRSLPEKRVLRSVARNRAR
jgi:hypothetical protein